MSSTDDVRDTQPAASAANVAAAAANTNAESIHAAKDVATMVVLVAAAVYLAATNHGELAATALGGALTYAMPNARIAGRPVPPVAMGLLLGYAVSLAH